MRGDAQRFADTRKHPTMNTDRSSCYDVIIIGGGPAGLSAALLLARSCRRPLVIDAGQPRNAAARELHGFIGRDATSPGDLARDARRDLAKYGVEIVADVVTSATELPQSAEQPFRTAFALRTESGRSLSGRKLLLATGITDELPDLPGLSACYGATVHHCPYCDGWEHRGKRLMAYGESTSRAVGLGLLLRGWSEDVTVLTHGQPCGTKDQRRLAANGIRTCEERVDRLLHTDHQLDAVQFESGRTIPADALFFNTGHHLTSSLPALLGCKLSHDGSAPTTRKQKTDVPGVFLAGDAAGHVQFVIVAAAEGATAAVAINRELQDEDRLESPPHVHRSDSSREKAHS